MAPRPVLQRMTGESVHVQLARHQWEEGARRLRRETDSAAASRSARQMEVVVAELSRLVGQVFTLSELARVYADADRWSLTLIHDALPDDPVATASAAVDAAFGLYARRASDYCL